MFGKKKVSMKKGRINLLQDKIGGIIDILLDSNVQIFIAPNSDEYFLIDGDKSISVCLEYSSIKVANHDYLYSESLPLKFIEKQKVKVKEVMETRNQNLKKELFKNEVDLLNKISEDYAG